MRDLASSKRVRSALPVLVVFCGAFSLYAATSATGTLFGDPSEYQFIPAILGIAHPPGYAFYTLLAKLWQTLVPVGTIAYRTNLLAAAVGAWTVSAVFMMVRDLVDSMTEEKQVGWYAAAVAALSLAVAADFWQHSIHSNAHIVSAGLASTHLWLLIRWWRTGKDGWLAAFAVAMGLAATHHPITLMGVPAYALFVLAVRPGLLSQWKLLISLVGFALLGLSPLLYYPLRSPTVPFGPTDMRSWQGFWQHFTAQGLRVNLFHFGLVDQLDRLTVFWSILRLQFPLLIIAFVALGLVGLVRRAPRPALLFFAFVTGHLLFTLNTVQDVMAYLLLPFVALAAAGGYGVWVLARLLERQPLLRAPLARRLLLVALVLPWPVAQAAVNLSRGISLRDFVSAEEWVANVGQRFGGREEGAVLLSDWEHLTPLWVHEFTQGEVVSEDDLNLVYVSTANPWVESAWTHIEEGSIYLPDYRPAIRDAGFRLVPEGGLYRVAAPPAPGLSPEHVLDVWADGRVHIVGYDLPVTEVSAGEHLRLTLYQGVDEPLDGIWMPYAQLGSVEARWTTDSRLLTPQWMAGETVAELYEIPVPFNLPPGEYPLRLGYADLTGGRAELELSGGVTLVDLGAITVRPNDTAPAERVLERLLSNLDNQVGLERARARVGLQMRRAPWQDPLLVRAGDAVHVTLTWRALATPRESQTIFIHLIDGAGQYVWGHDYTPLGGAAPTYLWFPKWLAGQKFTDPYRLVIPPGTPAGEYWLEVGMYGMTSLRRLPVVDLAGNLAGDRVILGPISIVER